MQKMNKKIFAYKSDLHGRWFWLTDGFDLRSHPFIEQKLFTDVYMPIADTTGDYVSDWSCFDDLDLEQHQELIKIQKTLFCFEHMQKQLDNSELRHIHLIQMEE